MTLEELDLRIRVTKSSILRFEDAISARSAEKRPPNVPEWAWRAEFEGISSILTDLHTELAALEAERFQGWLLGTMAPS
jgi:hypothetical protein